MANGAGECDLACQTKIIIDGGLAGKIFEETCYGIKHFLDKGGTLNHGKKVLKQLIKAEIEAYKFQKAALVAMGFTGPWPPPLDTLEHDE